MILLKLSSVHAHPKEVFKALEDRKSEIEWAQRKDNPQPPKYQKQPKIKLTAGVYNFIKNNVLELRP